MADKSLKFQNCLIHYSVYGKGIPVMLVHGFGEDSSIWQHQIDHLQTNCQLIVPDLPGTGNSELLQGNAGLKDYAGTLKTILDNEGVKNCIMIGHSMGGYATLAFAEKYSNMLTAFGLFHSSAYADDTEKKLTRKKAIGFIQQNGAQAFLKTAIPGLFYNESNSKTQIDELLEKGKNFSPGALIQYYGAMIARPDRTHILKSAAAPVLFILGQHDKAVPFNQGLEQVHLPEISMVHVLRNSAHMGMLEETGEANRILAEFLEGFTSKY
ncbi:MAG: alpha/beta hydrolase [Ferruginibacter sp.]